MTYTPHHFDTLQKPMRLLIVVLTSICLALSLNAQTLKPYGALPSPSQQKWHEMQYYMFIHFGPNTFTNLEWGKGSEDPKVFSPAQLDCRQWAATAKQAGMKGLIITAKHHDGFCLWPSKFSTHTVRESGWKNGEGDVLNELSQACKEYGLKFGVYLSPWDRNHPNYGTEEYNKIFVNMLGEVLTNYGEVFEQWFDGANGEGPNGKKQVYDWKLFNNTVYKHQPSAIIFSDGGPGCRWVGNEEGVAGETNWNTLNGNKVYPGYPDFKELTTGHEDGTHWIPAECDVSIRPGWFYSPDTDSKVKTVQQLKEIYFASIGRGGNLLLNVPVDRRGLIPAGDSIRLVEFKTEMDKCFATNLAFNQRVLGSALNGYPTKNLVDGKLNTSWVPSDYPTNRSFIVQLKHRENFNCIVLQENIAVGQRIKSFKVEVGKGEGWKEVASGTTVGFKRIIRFDLQQAIQIKVSITESKAAPSLSELGIYRID
jgi:alpha-L-fucosidase